MKELALNIPGSGIGDPDPTFQLLFSRESRILFSFHIAIPHFVTNFGESRFPGVVKSLKISYRFSVKSRIPRIQFQTLIYYCKGDVWKCNQVWKQCFSYCTLNISPQKIVSDSRLFLSGVELSEWYFEETKLDDLVSISWVEIRSFAVAI